MRQGITKIEIDDSFRSEHSFELAAVSDIKNRIDRVRLSEPVSPAESTLLDICEQLADLVSQLALRRQ